MQLFDYTKILFSRNEEEWKKISDSEKNRNFFMLNRFMSIKFPYQVHMLSRIRVSAPAVSDYWHRTMSSLHNGQPNWIYAKTKKKDESKKALSYYPVPSMVRWICEKEEISMRDFDERVSLLGEEYLKEVQELEKVLLSQGVISK